MKFIIKAPEEEQMKSKPWEVMKMVPEPIKKCNTCNKNERRQGSAYCGQCSNDYIVYGKHV